MPIKITVAAPPEPPYPEQPSQPGDPPLPPPYPPSGLVPPTASRVSPLNASTPELQRVAADESAPPLPTPTVIICPGVTVNVPVTWPM